MALHDPSILARLANTPVARLPERPIYVLRIGGSAWYQGGQGLLVPQVTVGVGAGNYTLDQIARGAGDPNSPWSLGHWMSLLPQTHLTILGFLDRWTHVRTDFGFVGFVPTSSLI